MMVFRRGLCALLTVPMTLVGAVVDKLDADPYPVVTPEWTIGPVEKKPVCFPESYLSSDSRFALPHVWRVATVDGTPRVTQDGQPFDILWGAVRGGRPDGTKRHSDAPVNLVTVYNSVGAWWPHENEFRPELLDQAAAIYARDNPNAWFMFDLSIYPPPDWCKRNVDEMCRDESGALVKDGRPTFSLTSKKALADFLSVLEKAISHIEASPYANRVIGYRINSGHTIEWLGWFRPNPNTTLDFSPSAQRGFESWARERYPQISDFSVPTLKERIFPKGTELLWHVDEHIRPVAYHRYLSDVTADDVIAMCRRARELTHGRKLIGTYYGYVMTLWSGGIQQIQSHFSLKRLLDAKAVDFLLSPQPYGYRNLGENLGDMKPFATLAANGVLPILENDARTHNGPYIEKFNCLQTPTLQATLGITRRDLATVLCRNQVPYFYSLNNGTEFDFPEWSRDAAAAAAVGRHCRLSGVRRRAEIAVVVSEETIKAMPILQDGSLYAFDGNCRQRYRKDGTVEVRKENAVPFASDPFGSAYVRYSRIGAPVDYVLAEDLKDHPGDYRLYVFANSFLTDEAFRRCVGDLRRREATLLWLSAPGYLDRASETLEAMAELTGLTFVKRPERAEPYVVMEGDGRTMGTRGFRMSPLFSVCDADEVLARYDDGTAGVAVKRTDRATSVFCGPYQTDLAFLRDIAKRAGVTICSDSGDPFESNDRLITLHARTAGRKTLRLPRRTAVLDVFNRKLVARDADIVTFDAPLHSSWLFYCADDAEELLAKIEKGENR